MKNDEFVFEKVVYLTDTNAEGNVYFARFFEWQGMAREEFLRQNVPDHMEILGSGVRLITANAWMTYQSECRLFDVVKIKINTASLKPASLELVFTFLKKGTDEPIGRGGERLTFASKDGQLIQIPKSIRENAERFLVNPAPEVAELGLRRNKILQGSESHGEPEP